MQEVLGILECQGIMCCNILTLDDDIGTWRRCVIEMMNAQNELVLFPALDFCSDKCQIGWVHKKVMNELRQHVH